MNDAELEQLDPDFQHQQDLAVLDRIERQNECYFDAMGEHHAQRSAEPQR